MNFEALERSDFEPKERLIQPQGTPRTRFPFIFATKERALHENA